jgi:phosphoglycerol transferase MdoB-like AlkP superfamily enzyme
MEKAKQLIPHFYNQSVLSFRRILLLVGIYSGLRLVYFIYNQNLLHDENTAEVFLAFLNGVRFDVYALVALNLLFIALWFLPARWQVKKVWRSTVDVVFVGVNTLLIALNLVDIELINFNSRRLTPVFFTLTQDVGGQLPQLIAYYWWLALSIIALGCLVSYLMPKVSLQAPDQISLKNQKFFIFIFVFFLFFSFRGGLIQPLTQAAAFEGSPDIGHLALNTTFTFVKWRPTPVQTFSFFSSEEMNEILEQRMHLQESSSELTSLKPKNVVIIILESFALEYMGEIANGRPGYTPFLDELATRSLFFKNAFANGKRSIEVMPSLLASFPSLLDEPFLQSTSQYLKLNGLPQLLKSSGFKSYFFHGAHNGSMFFDKFSSRIGFDKYFGLNEYPEPVRDSDGSWGILDEPYLQYFAQQLTKEDAPFLGVVFTLSSHQPYPVPKDMKDQFPEGALAIHESIGYADYALKKFFETAAQQPWYKDTLFIITADHTQLIDDPKYLNFLGRYRVPLLLFKEGQDWSGYNGTRLVQHADVTASVLDILQIKNQNKNYVSGSVLNRDKKGFVINRDSKGYWYFDGECFLWLLMDGRDQLQSGPESCREEPLRFFKAYIQNFTERVNLDKWSEVSP